MASPTDFEATFEPLDNPSPLSLAKAEASDWADRKTAEIAKVLGENLLRNCDKLAVHEDDIRDSVLGRAIRRWSARSRTIIRILMPTAGIPLLVDLRQCVMRSMTLVAIRKDQSALADRLRDRSPVNVDYHGRPDALQRNTL